MALTYPEIRNFAGLYKQANSFTVPDGALEEVLNFIVTRDRTLSKRRGFYEYYVPVGQTLNNLFTYQSKLVAVFADQIAYFTETGSDPSKTGVKNALTGATVALASPRAARGVESNKNLYLTTDNGVVKLEAYNSSVFKAGVPPALDLRGKFNPANGMLTAETQAAWRTVFGRRDVNDNLLLGAPSDVVVLTNSKVVGAAWACATNVITVTTTSPHNLAAGMQITVSNSTSDTSSVTAAPYTIATVPTATTFTFAFTVGDDASGNTLDYTATRTAILEQSIPSEIDSTAGGWFVQIYRSTQTNSSATSPSADFKLVDEITLTSAQITAGLFFYSDDTDDLLLGAQLYTNPNSREGELQANDRPPLARDLTIFKNHLIYGNCQTRHLLNLQVTDPSALATGDFFEVKIGSIVRRYVARTGVGNSTVKADSLENDTGALEINYVAHGLANGDSVYISNITGGTLTAGFYYVINRTADDFHISTTPGGSAVAYASETALDFQGGGTRQTAVTGLAWVRAANVVTVTSAAHGLSIGMLVYISNSSGGVPEITSGLYTITAADTNTFSFADVATADASGNTLNYAAFHPMFRLDTASSSAAVKLRNTAQGLAKAINRDTGSLAYGRYTSGITDVPGKVRLLAKGFTGAIYLRANTAGAGASVSPVVPASFASGTQVFSRNDQLTSSWFSSKIGEPEAVPILNQFPAGARNQELLRVVALRDAMLLIKADGVFRVTGDGVSNFSTTPLDATVICIAPNTVKLINNEVIFLSNQGWAKCTDSSVSIIDRDVADVMTPILGDETIDALSAAVAYETDHTYLASTREPTTDETSRSYAFNVFNGGWAESDVLFRQGLVGPADKLFLVTTDNTIVRERKNQTKIDYCGQNYTVTIDTVAANLLSATITSLTAQPRAGWVIVKADSFSRINAVTVNGGGSYTVTFTSATNVEALDSLQLYASYRSVAKLAPFHAGAIGRMKQFCEMQIHMRDSAVSALSIWFANTYYDSSDFTSWFARAASTGGYGLGSFGYSPWGDTTSIDLTTGTLPMPPVRLNPPTLVQRGTFIQPVIEHDQAGEPVQIQAVTFTVRPYGARVST